MNKLFNQLTSQEIPKLLLNGEIGILPTDTLYGLVARAADRSAVSRLYSAKSRSNKPGTVIAAGINQLVGLGLKKRYLKAVEHFWPNPISIVIPCGPQLSYLHLGQHSLAVRIPADKTLNKLMIKSGPLLTSSANLPAAKPAVNIAQAEKYFSDKVDFYVDGGDLSSHKPSTVIRIIDDAIDILRQGAVTIDEAGRVS